MKVLILEDEHPAFNKLLQYLTEIFENELKYDHVRSVTEGVRVLEKENKYDLIFSDIKLLDGLAFKIFETVELACPIIFCTAHDQHLMQAFKTNGIAYILKPYSQSEIRDAITKYERLFSKSPMDQNIIKEINTLFLTQRKSYKKRFAVKRNSGIQLLDTKDVSFIRADGDFSKLIDNAGNSHLISQKIGTLSIELDPSIFFRVNRSYIVNIEYIEKIIPYSRNRLSVKMKTQEETILTTSTSTKDFRKWLER